jgi:hypothetical protein
MDPLLFRSPLSLDLGFSGFSCLSIVVDIFLLVLLRVVCGRVRLVFVSSLVLVLVMVLCCVVLMNVLVASLTCDGDGDDKKCR